MSYQPPPKQPESLRIASLNLWGRFGDWQGRLALVAGVWPEIDADVLVAQEVCVDEDGDQGADVAERLSYPGWSATTAPGRDEGVAIFSRSPLQHIMPAALPQSEPARCMLGATIASPDGGLRLLTSHLVSGPSPDNDRQLEWLLAHDDSPALVIGADLNADPPEVSRYLKPNGLRDDLAGSVSATTPTDAGLFREAWRDRLGSYPDLDSRPRRLDYLLSRGCNARAVGSVVIRDGELLGSDHALIWADYG